MAPLNTLATLTLLGIVFSVLAALLQPTTPAGALSLGIAIGLAAGIARIMWRYFRSS